MSDDSQLALPKEDVALALGRLQELESIMRNFGLTLHELDQLITQEYHHFAAHVEGTNTVRIYTRHCVFSIDLTSKRASVCASETVWMHAVMQARLQIEAAEVKAGNTEDLNRYLSDQVDDLRSRLDTLRGEKFALIKGIGERDLKLAAWKPLVSRYMKSIRGGKKKKSNQVKKKRTRPER